jgi:CDP-2,3-bis-(O-geranylgeranyl)-sn-glycerol synthase
MRPLLVAQLLALLILANGTPVLAKKLLGARLAWPLDGGLRFFDGRPLLGGSKTVRGVVLAAVVTAAGAPFLGLDSAIGALIGATAMAGDLAASFVKRRLGRPPSSRATGLDQVPEALLPLIACRAALDLSWLEIAAAVALFVVGEMVLSRPLYRLHVRDRPY